MLRNYLKRTWRGFMKNKTYAVLNIAGLSAGLACFAFIALWVKDELSYDSFNKKKDRIVRVIGSTKTNEGVSHYAVTSAPMAQALKNDYPEVQDAVRFDMHEEIIEQKNQQTLQSGILVTDPSFFNIFSYKLTRGDVKTALNEPFSLILTESAAKKYFGDADPIGETLKIFMLDSNGRGELYKITGLMPDPPKNAHFTFSMLASFKTVEVVNPDVLTADGWGDASYYTYLLMKEGVDYKAFSSKIQLFYGKYIGNMFNVWKDIYSYRVQPLMDIHLHSDLQYGIAATGSITQVYIFGSISIFILLLAAINYVNLSTARAVTRAKEVGIKKVVGAERKQLITQFLFESVITALVAFIISILLCSLLQSLFYQVTAKDLSILSSVKLIGFLAGISILLGVLSGIYPAFVISRFKPTKVLKGSFKSGASGVFVRKSLVMTQFAITLVLITGIIIINSQMNYIQHKDLGYNRQSLVFLRVHGNTDVINGYESFRNELLSNSMIAGAAASNSLPIAGFDSGGAETVDADGNPVQVNTSRLRVDMNYLDVYGIKKLAGRNFAKPAEGDSIRQIVLNESAVKKFGWKDAQTAIGKPFRMGNQKGTVIGVVKDFHFNSLQTAIEPLAIYPLTGRFSRITLNAEVSRPGQVISWIEKIWKKHFPSALFDYDFLEKQVEEQYLAEQRFSKIFLYFSVLSLLIACLGLYGLIAYAASQKSKEIGVRKVLGATVNNIVLMLFRDFIKPVGIAFLIAVPVCWFIMNNWLQEFAYRIEISWWMFAVAGLSVIVVAFATAGFQAIKAAIANPVKSLRTE